MGAAIDGASLSKIRLLYLIHTTQLAAEGRRLLFSFDFPAALVYGDAPAWQSDWK